MAEAATSVHTTVPFESMPGHESAEPTWTAETDERDESIERDRMLSDIRLLQQHLLPDGTVPEIVRQDVLLDLTTAIHETGIPGSVTDIFHRADYVVQPVDGDTLRLKRVFRWLGKTALEVAESGRRFYVTAAGNARGLCEEAEAPFIEEYLQQGVAFAFISPRMTLRDGSADDAKRERLDSDDSIRVSTAVTDEYGAVIGRRMRSLLVRDVPLAAWVDLLQDPANIFGKQIVVADPGSALSVMQVFQDLCSTEMVLQDGPVKLVEEVLRYVSDESARQSIARQISLFRADQEQNHLQATLAAEDWLQFDIDLARSLQCGIANKATERFITSMQHNWGRQDAGLIQEHRIGHAYRMTDELAVVLEKARRYLSTSQAAVATGSQDVAEQMGSDAMRQMQQDIYTMQSMRSQGIDPAIVALQLADMQRGLTRQNLKMGGGCAGSSEGNFSGNGTDGDEFGDPRSQNSPNTANGNQIGNWKKGVCRARDCQSPQPTDIGPCEVCRLCQDKSDAGHELSDAVAVFREIDSDLRVLRQKVVGDLTRMLTKKESYTLIS